MQKSEYADRIKRQLGYPTVNVELTEDQLNDAVDNSFIEIEKYITDPHFVTLPTANRIDMTSYSVEFIIDVYKSPTQSPALLDAYVNVDPFMYASTMTVDDIATRLNLQRLALSLKDRLHHKWVKPYIFIDMAAPISSSVTIEYVPNFTDVSQVTSSHWVSLIYRLAVANAKEMLGRVRGKHRVSGSPVEFDGDTLLSEASIEKDAVRVILEDQADSFFPTD